MPPKPLTGGKRELRSTPRRKKSDGTDVNNPPSILRNKGKLPTDSPEKKKPRGRSRDPSLSRGRSASRTPKEGRNRSKSANKDSAKKTPITKKTAKPSFADKLKTPPSPKKPIKRLKNMAYVAGIMSMPKSSQLRMDVYRNAGMIITTFQAVQGGKNTRILNYKDIEEKPLMSAAQMPTLHAEVSKYIHFDVITRHWNGETIPNGKTRKIEFSCLVESDIPIEELVEAVQIDLIDARIQLHVKTCQAIRHYERMHLLYVSNKFNRKQVEKDLHDQLTKLQQDYYLQDKNSELGRREAMGKHFPKIYVKVDYPFNGPFEKTKTGQDTRYKRVFVIEYSVEDQVHVETAVQLYKRSGRLSQFWGEHANIQIAPDKDPDITPATSLEKWHSILESHNATMLSFGMIRLDGIKSPDAMVPISYWKSSSKPRPDKVCLRDVLHSIKVSGTEREVQVLHGLVRTPDGGFEAAVADTNPFAKSMARNIATHPAGWIMGYVASKGWKKESIETFMKKAFTTSAVVAAQQSSFDKKTGQVTSDDLEDVDRELRNVTESWVDMSLLTAGKEVVQEHAVLDGADMAAFDWEAGASVKTMTNSAGGEISDNETSLVNSSDEEEHEEEYSGDERENMSEEGEGEEDENEEIDEETYWAAISAAVWPLRELFNNDEKERDEIVEMLQSGDLPYWIVQDANQYNDLADEAVEIDEKIVDLTSEEVLGEDEEAKKAYDQRRQMLDSRLNEIKLEMEEIRQQLHEALKEIVRDKEGDSSARPKHSVGFSGNEEEEAQEDLNDFQDAEMNADNVDTDMATPPNDAEMQESPKQHDAQSSAGHEPG